MNGSSCITIGIGLSGYTERCIKEILEKIKGRAPHSILRRLAFLCTALVVPGSSKELSRFDKFTIPLYLTRILLLFLPKFVIRISLQLLLCQKAHLPI